MMALLEQLPSITLFVMMLAMGMGLGFADFARIAAQPRAAMLGVFGQLFALPLLAVSIAWLLALPEAVAIGLLIIAVCPGGNTSNAFSFMARGDVALSISLTAVSSMVAFLWVPMILGTALPVLGFQAETVRVPFLDTMIPILSTTAIPVVAGMILRSRRPALCERLQQPLLKGSISVLMLLIVGLPIQLAAQSVDLIGIFTSSAPAVVLLIVGGMGMAWLGGRALRIERRQVVTVSIEVGIQNFALAMVLALSVFQQPVYLAPGIVYLPVMLLLASGLVWLGRREPASVPETQLV